MAGKAGAIFGGGGIPVGAIVQGDFAADTNYLPLDGMDYTAATYPLLTKTSMKTFGSNSMVSRTLPATGIWRCVTYGGSQFVMMGSSVCATSPDGITWTSRTVAAVTFTCVIYAGGQYVAGTSAGVIYTSPDAITWTSRGTVTSQYVESIAYGNGIYVVTLDGTEVVGAGQVVTSPDAITWTSRTVIGGGVSLATLGVNFQNGRFYLTYYSVNTGQACYTFMISADGITWFYMSQQILGSTGAAVGINASAAPVRLRNKWVLMGSGTNCWIGDEGVGQWANLPMPCQGSRMVQLDNIGAVVTAAGGGTVSINPYYFSFDFKRWYAFNPTSSGRWLIYANGVAASSTRAVIVNQDTAGTVSTCQSLDIDSTKFRMPLSTPTGNDAGDADRYFMKVA